MSMIYSFLQKKKMHENQHGIVMVVTAYVLSFIMLVLGSDAFYNIKSRAAAGINMISDEVTQKQSNESMKQQIFDLSSGFVKEKLMNPYGFYSMRSLDENVQRRSDLATNQQNWLVGQAINTQKNNVLYQVDNFITLEENVKTDNTVDTNEVVSTMVKEVETKKEISNEIVQSFSVDKKAKNTNTAISVTKEETEMLERIVEAEATGEDMKGKILVANVIFNRVNDDDFPDTIKEVIFQNSHGDYQFSPVSDERFWSVKVSKGTKEAVERALQGEDYSEGALYFMARKRTDKSKWFDNHLKWLFKHGGHEFYKNK